MDDIDSKKKDIAYAISLAYADGDKVKAENEFPYIYETIKNCKHFIFKNTSDFNANSYSKSVDHLLDEIDKKIGYFSVKKSFYNPKKFVFKNDPLQGDSKGLDERVVSKLKSSYFHNKKMFLRLGISYQTFINIAISKGQENVLELTSLVKKLEFKSKMYKLKSYFSNYQDLMKFKISSENAFDVIDDFKINSLDDLLVLYTGVSSFFVNMDDLDDNEKKIIMSNKIKLKKMIKDPKLLESERYILKLKEKLEKMFSSSMFKEVITECNCKDFFKRYGFSVTSDNLINILKEYYYSYGVSGFRTINKFDGKDVNLVYFNSNLFNNNLSYQNETIIHEFIHCLEPISKESIERPFSAKCRYLNEALTEFLAIEAMRYLSGSIVHDSNVTDCVESESVYLCLLPMVEVLKNSALWNDIISCKKMNDYSLLEERIGNDATRISQLFTSAYLKRRIEFFDRNLPENDELFELKNIIAKIEKKNYRYNKSVS